MRDKNFVSWVMLLLAIPFVLDALPSYDRLLRRVEAEPALAITIVSLLAVVAGVGYMVQERGWNWHDSIATLRSRRTPSHR